jgi:hypothetical protein
MKFAVAALAAVIFGIWMRYSLPFVEKHTSSGEPWIKMAMCLTYASQSRRNTKAAMRFFRKLLKGVCYVPRVIITDKLKSYGAAKRGILPGVEHRQHKRLNNRAENSHQPHPRHDCARRKCGGSNQQSMPNVFSLLIAPYFPAFPTAKTPSAC